jgi:hypothetical protein
MGLYEVRRDQLAPDSSPNNDAQVVGHADQFAVLLNAIAP